MKKVIRANSKIGSRKMMAIVAELERWREGELGTKLTWERVEAFSGFTRQALSRHAEIARAYHDAKGALARPGRKSRSRTMEGEREYFDQTLERLRAEVERYKVLEQQWFQRWQRIAFHCARRGMSIDDLDQALDVLNRKGT